MSNYTAEEQKQLDRVALASVVMSDDQARTYLSAPDDLGEETPGAETPDGYKRCGGCHHILKLYLFNINNSSKNKCTGNCKACQKTSASKSYDKTKGSRNYKQYYEDHREQKQEHSRKYYADHKDELLPKQRGYHASAKGKKVMQKAHSKRKHLLATNTGIPYKREDVIDRDKMGGDFAICYLCDLPITAERNLQLDHVVPVVIGGLDCFTNVACVHNICNLRKEKDARKLSASQVDMIVERAEKYIDDHPDKFPGV